MEQKCGKFAVQAVILAFAGLMAIVSKKYMEEQNTDLVKNNGQHCFSDSI